MGGVSAVPDQPNDELVEATGPRNRAAISNSDLWPRPAGSADRRLSPGDRAI